jgi:hypothetical protein
VFSDINECLIDPDICGANATCSDTPGSYTCTCDEGYVLFENPPICGKHYIFDAGTYLFCG